jgi:WhiB family redox-sensing transcriptional regulator
MVWHEDWPTMAACRGADPDALFVQGAAQNRAKLVCGGCPVRAECLADALDNRIEFGVWGGMTERERRALLRRQPHVTSWRNVLEGAKKTYEQAAPCLPRIPAARTVPLPESLPESSLSPSAPAAPTVPAP